MPVLSDPSERDWRETEEIFERILSVSDKAGIRKKGFYYSKYVKSGCWESNPVSLLPKQVYYRYTTAR